MLYTFKTKSGIEIKLDFSDDEKAIKHAQLVLEACKCNKVWIFSGNEDSDRLKVATIERD